MPFDFNELDSPSNELQSSIELDLVESAARLEDGFPVLPPGLSSTEARARILASPEYNEWIASNKNMIFAMIAKEQFATRANEIPTVTRESVITELRQELGLGTISHADVLLVLALDLKCQHCGQLQPLGHLQRVCNQKTYAQLLAIYQNGMAKSDE